MHVYPDGWVHDKKGGKVAEHKYIKTAEKFAFNAKKATYYVQIKAQWANDAPPNTDAYTISATSKAFTVASMKGKKITYKSSSDTLKWSKAKKVDGYEIQVCKNKKFKTSSTKVYTTDKNTYTLPWTLANGSYYVRIRAYCDALGGDKLYGKFTKAKKIKKK